MVNSAQPFLYRVNDIKKDPKAIAILLDINFYGKRAVSEIKEDLNLSDDLLIKVLDVNNFIRPNPHRQVEDINYRLTEKGTFLINEIKAENPQIFEELEIFKSQL